MNSSPVSCTNCHQESTADGKMIWVCDNCLAVNQPNSSLSPASAPTFPSAAPDVTEAQAAINAAAAEAEKSVIK